MSHFGAKAAALKDAQACCPEDCVLKPDPTMASRLLADALEMEEAPKVISNLH